MERQDDIIDFDWPEFPDGARKGARPGSPRERTPGGQLADDAPPTTGPSGEMGSSGADPGTPATRPRLNTHGGGTPSRAGRRGQTRSRGGVPTAADSSILAPSPRTKLITWAQELPTSDGTPYLRRWVLDLGVCSLRLHHWLCSDDDRAPHDHPYWLVTLLLKGGYDDMVWTPDPHPLFSDVQGSYAPVSRRAPSIRFWRATHTHYVRVHEGGCWSLCLAGRQSRVWGFWQMRGDGVRRWVRSSRYFRRVGHHACDR